VLGEEQSLVVENIKSSTAIRYRNLLVWLLYQLKRQKVIHLMYELSGKTKKIFVKLKCIKMNYIKEVLSK